MVIEIESTGTKVRLTGKTLVEELTGEVQAKIKELDIFWLTSRKEFLFLGMRSEVRYLNLHQSSNSRNVMGRSSISKFMPKLTEETKVRRTMELLSLGRTQIRLPGICSMPPREETSYLEQLKFKCLLYSKFRNSGKRL